MGGRSTAAARTGTAIRLMISYVHEDEKYETMLAAHLSALSRSGRIDVWQDREIPPGKEYVPEILKQIDRRTSLCYSSVPTFWPRIIVIQGDDPAIERHKNKEARVTPVIVRNVDWKDTPVRGLNALPKDGLAVTFWDDLDKAWQNVAAGIRIVVQELTREQ